jgi:streptogramin lyase
MSIRTGLVALSVLAALSLGLGACSGGGGTPSSERPQAQPSSAGSTSQTAMRTYQLGGGAGSYDLPPIGGFTGSLALPAAIVPANTRLELTSSLQAPTGSPLLQGAERRPQATGTLNVYFYTTIRLSSTVTFPTLPAFSVTLPATVKPIGLWFFYAISNPSPGNGAKVQFRTEGPATVSGQSVSFAPSSNRLTLQAGQPYTIAFYAISAIAATPAPTFTGKIYVLNLAGPGGENGTTLKSYTANGTATSPTINTSLNGPRGVAVDAAGKIYITNFGAGALTTYTPNGTPTTPTIGLTAPWGVAVDAAGKIYVANFGYGSGDSVSTFTANGAPTSPRISMGLSSPQDVAVDAAGKIYVTNYGNGIGVVTTYLPNGVQTTPTIGTVSGPEGVAVDAAGKIYVANSSNNTVTTFNSDGTPSTPTITGLSNPQGVAVDATGKIYVTNVGNNTLTTYSAKGTQTTPTITGLNYPVGVALH